MHDVELWRTLAQWTEAAVPCALCSVVSSQGPVPRQPGARMVVQKDGQAIGTVGGGALEREVIAAAREVINAGVPRLLSFQLKPDLGMLCGGQVQVFIDPMQVADRLYLFGAGHIGQALAPFASRVGFAVTVIDARPELACPARFPEAAAFLHDFDPAVWGGLGFDEARTYCVVVSPSHQTDFLVVGELLRRPTRYLGMIGSSSKRAAAEAWLRQAGFTAEQMAALRTPVGESIGAETPEEIAISIVAELVRVRRGPPRPAGG